MKRVLIISGRFQKENPFREVTLIRECEKRNYQTTFAIPDLFLNEHGYNDPKIIDHFCNSYNAELIHNADDFKELARPCDMVLFGSWKNYGHLATISRSLGLPTANFNSTSGLDHWPHGVDYAFVKGPFSKRQMLYYQEKIPGYGNLPEDKIIVTGSIAHEKIIEKKDCSLNLTKKEFCNVYGLDPSLPIITFFPKGIGSFSQKVHLWFKNYSSEQIKQYNNKFIQKYFEICKAVKKSNCNLLVKMHPTAYVSYRCKIDDEFHFWQNVPWAKILNPIHTYDCYNYTDCGVGINTHSALDLGYFGKPFIYVDSNKYTLPDAIQFHINHLCSLPLGPSDNWDKNTLNNINPWFPSWLGFFSDIEELCHILKEKIPYDIPRSDKQRFIEEFWYKNDGKAAERIFSIICENLLDVPTDSYYKFKKFVIGKRKFLQ